MDTPMDITSDGVITTSTRSQGELGARLETWLAGVLAPDVDPKVTELSSPDSNGMSSETILFTVTTTDGGRSAEQHCVARIEPELDKVPVFPTYDLRMQFDVMRLVGEATTAPVPPTLWFEPDPSVVGAPFLVMGRVDGRVPPDVMPYTFGDCWVTDATPEERALLQRSALSAIAAIHSITPDDHDLSFLEPSPPLRPLAGNTALARNLDWWDQYREWVTDDAPSVLLDECFAWLRDTMPATTDARLSWGDARIGNMLFDGFDVAAVLDWEMAGIAPAELDLGWTVYLHRFFQDLAEQMGMPGLPDFMTEADVTSAYAELTGRTPDDLQWYASYAAMRHGVIMRRVTERAVLFGQAVRPADPDEMVMHRATLRQMLDGTYWDRVA
ncbi:MAG: phosphotransferase family protein [Acidimicrobiales bacterium]|nr:phosphotransferase family protein [Acidimicrobiales bacterium]